MRCLMSVILVAVVLQATQVVGAGPEGNIVGTMKMDPVALLAGRKEAGRDDLFVEHYIYRYHFAAAENRTAFLADPARYEIQFGGGCARMGSLSGLGDPERYAVHDGRLYIFASDGCRKAFLSDPEEFMENDDPVPTGNAEALRRGRELIEKAVDAMGGASRIDAVKSYRSRSAGIVEYEGKRVDKVVTTTVFYPDSIRHDYAWGDDVWSTVSTLQDAWFTGPDGERPMHAQQRSDFRRRHLGQHLLSILKLRRSPGFVAYDRGLSDRPREGRTIAVRLVEVGCRGVTSLIAVDPDTGRVHSIAYRRRGPSMRFGRVEKVYDRLETVGGVELPVAPVVFFDGERVERSSDDEPTIELNVEYNPAEFTRR